MGRIVISTNMTLDGISQDPTGEEGFEFGGWFTRIVAADREAWAKLEYEETLSAAALLVGARSYDWFAERWVGRPGDWAVALNALPKYVVRARDGRADWGPTTVVTGDIAGKVAALTQQVDGDIVVYASYQLVRLLAEQDMIDEVRLVVFPHVVGAGGRVFSELTVPRALRLAGVDRIGESLVQLTYGRAAS
jgi:dihydrofolate reductase